MLDKVLMTVSMLALIGFMGIVLVFVNELDLWLITVVVLVMAVHDFYTTLRDQDKKAKP